MDLNVDGERMADMFDEYCDIARLDESRSAMAQLSKKVVSQSLKGHSALSGLRTLKSQLDSNQQLMLDSYRFELFYRFVFFICCEPGQKNLDLSTAIEAWRLVLAGKFRLLDQWCDFVQKNSQYNISKDTWQQLLEFTQREPGNLKGYDPQGAWPLLIDEFVSDMHRRLGFSNYTHISNALVFPGAERLFWHCHGFCFKQA